MLKIILSKNDPIMPFCEPARELRIQNKSLFLYQEHVLDPYITKTLELKKNERLEPVREPAIVYRNNLFFDELYIKNFMEQALTLNRPVRAAFRADDPAFHEHALPLSTSYTPAGSLYLADLWYYPKGPVAGAEPLVIDLWVDKNEDDKKKDENKKKAPPRPGYSGIPRYMADKEGELTFYVPRKGAFIAIDSWVHVFIADIIFGQFARAEYNNYLSHTSLSFQLRLLATALYEGCQVLRSSALVKIGKNCRIHPSVIINGPAIIGDEVVIEEGTIIENCIIGNNVNISQGCQLMLSVVGDGSFLPFGAKLFMTTLMDNSVVAQNTCLQMCVIGRNTFIGAGSTWTDFNLMSSPIRARDGNGKLNIANRPVLGGCVGHNCRIGSGMIIYPARTIESDVVLAATNDRRVIDKDISFEDSDHHHLNKRLKEEERYKTPYHDKKMESW